MESARFIDRSISVLFSRPGTSVPICFVLAYRICVAFSVPHFNRIAFQNRSSGKKAYSSSTRG
jgi:hypothetical protein